jgi:hypothetical protein
MKLNLHMEQSITPTWLRELELRSLLFVWMNQIMRLRMMSLDPPVRGSTGCICR